MIRRKSNIFIDTAMTKLSNEKPKTIQTDCYAWDYTVFGWGVYGNNILVKFFPLSFNRNVHINWYSYLKLIQISMYENSKFFVPANFYDLYKLALFTKIILIHFLTNNFLKLLTLIYLFVATVISIFGYTIHTFAIVNRASLKSKNRFRGRTDTVYNLVL